MTVFFAMFGIGSFLETTEKNKNVDRKLKNISLAIAYFFFSAGLFQFLNLNRKNKHCFYIFIYFKNSKKLIHKSMFKNSHEILKVQKYLSASIKRL